MYGLGRTHVMSSTELIFSGDQAIEPGMQAEVSLAWPAKLNENVRLQLVLEGSIKRAEGKLAVLHIVKYHFRTRGHWEETPVAAPPQRPELLEATRDLSMPRRLPERPLTATAAGTGSS
jgi:hypothetical protein